MNRLPVRQIAYFVPDVRAAARAHSAAFGSGPYFVAEHIPLAVSRHRGVDAYLDHTSAYGQWGEVMIEFVQQNNDGPSAFRDMFGTDGQGLHHLAFWVDDLQQAIDGFAAEGLPLAFYAEMNDGFAFAFIDAVASHGHMLELYQPVASLTGFYKFVAKAARDWDGTDPVRDIAFS